MRRGWPLLLAMVAPALTGCSVNHDVLVAMGVGRQGTPAMYYEPCEPAETYTVSLFDLGTDPYDGKQHDPLWSIRHDGPIERLQGLELFAKPTGWTTLTDPPARFGWTDDHTYQVSVSSDGPYDASIRWTPGQLVAGRLLNEDDDGDAESVSPEVWTDRVADECGAG